MPAETYNGWKNYETWLVALHISNEPDTYEESRAMTLRAVADASDASQVASGIWTREEAARFTLADAVKDWVSEAREDGGWMPDVDGLAGDLIGAALSGVDWDEIAANWLSDVDWSRAHDRPEFA